MTTPALSRVPFIMRFIYSLPLRQIFTSRDVLKFAARATVDRTLSGLVRKGVIVRLCRGVFCRPEFGKPLPSLYEIILVKTRTFCRSIMTCGEDAAAACKLGESPETITFYTSGSTSSFQCQGKVIKLKHVSPRKMSLSDNKVDTCIKALWHLGKRSCKPEHIRQAVAKFDHQDRRELKARVEVMPAWLSNCWKLLHPLSGKIYEDLEPGMVKGYFDRFGPLYGLF